MSLLVIVIYQLNIKKYLKKSIKSLTNNAIFVKHFELKNAYFICFLNMVQGSNIDHKRVYNVS